ncbi:hypothetical protein [Maridesulfovibrio sp.]|uniref:hypothetical protein n=1 Tax=Maridesulfovibrio sp. TaxID=2795000 RepID=UPI0029CA270B|nr:hypothetical protein [Maridesulfovibrio sp.]
MKFIEVDVYMLDPTEYGWLWLCGKNTAQLGLTQRIKEYWLLGISVALTFETTEKEAKDFVKKEIGK